MSTPTARSKDTSTCARVLRLLCGALLAVVALPAAPSQAGPAIDWIEVSSQGRLHVDGGFSLKSDVVWAPDLPRVLGAAYHFTIGKYVFNHAAVNTSGGSARVGVTLGTTSREFVVTQSSGSGVGTLYGGLSVRAGDVFDVVAFAPHAALRNVQVFSMGGTRLKVRTGSGSQLLRLGGPASIYAGSATVGSSTMSAQPRTGIVGGFVGQSDYGLAQVESRSPDGRVLTFTNTAIFEQPPMFTGPGGLWNWTYTGASPGDFASGTVYGGEPGGMSSNVVGAWAPVGKGWQTFRDTPRP